MTMVRHAQMALDDDVAPQIPELNGFEQVFSLWSMINHSSSMPYYINLMNYQLGCPDSDYFGNLHIIIAISMFYEIDY